MNSNGNGVAVSGDGRTDGVAEHPLAGIPGVGTARRALLVAAGIGTREELARASVEQVVSITGMPRAAAERALRSLTETAEAVPPSDEALPGTTAGVAVASTPAAPAVPAPDVLAPGLGAPAPEEEQVAAPSALERAVFAARTAVSDVTRLSPDRPRLDRSLTRFAAVLDALVHRLPKLRPGVQRRITRRLERLTARLERITARTGDAGGAAPSRPLGPRRAERLRERLRAERRDIVALARLAPTPAGRKATPKRSKRAG